jgi:hypothetical protein
LLARRLKGGSTPPLAFAHAMSRALLTMFYNTINDVSSSLVTTRTQERIILDCFKAAKEPLSPSMVHFLTKLKCPITSIRRAMSDLTKQGSLTKTPKYTIGKFGKKEHLWVRAV